MILSGNQAMYLFLTGHQCCSQTVQPAKIVSQCNPKYFSCFFYDCQTCFQTIWSMQLNKSIVTDKGSVLRRIVTCLLKLSMSDQLSKFSSIVSGQMQFVLSSSFGSCKMWKGVGGKGGGEVTPQLSPSRGRADVRHEKFECRGRGNDRTLILYSTFCRAICWWGWEFVDVVENLLMWLRISWKIMAIWVFRIIIWMIFYLFPTLRTTTVSNKKSFSACHVCWCSTVSGLWSSRYSAKMRRHSYRRVPPLCGRSRKTLTFDLLYRLHKSPDCRSII